jgi:hypothetical protein
MVNSRRVNRCFILFLLVNLLGRTSSRGREPEEQVEKNWVDNRWNQTILGPFQACTLQFANGTVAKALAVNTGGKSGNSAVCYDTTTGSLRAAWIGGFLQFDPARYGLINKPRAAGAVQFLGPKGPAWNAPVEYLGTEIRGDRVLLRWRVDQSEVTESPSADEANGLTVISRTLEIAPSNKSLRLTLLDDESRMATIEKMDGVSLARVDHGGNSMVIVVRGDATIDANDASGKNPVIEFRAADRVRSAELSVWCGTKARLAEVADSVARRLGPIALPSSSVNAHWPSVETKGELGAGKQPWVIDTLTAPYDNPWKALLFFSGVDFLPNGDLLACTIHGDVWLVQGVDAQLSKLTWHRFATGLFQPLGLRVVDGRIYVLGRDRITVLRDLDANGEADVYENFSDLIETSAGGHDYVTCLETDVSGNFYYVDPRGVHRISSDGKSSETIASGWRNPNGMSVGPDRTITVAPQEGNWTPSSHIDVVRRDGYYGFGGPRITPERPLGYDLPLCWIPRSVDNSTGSQVWVTNDRWGIARGELLNLSFGRCSVQLVLRETVQGQAQGGVVALPGRFISGVMRGTFSPFDRQLYLAGAQGWQTAATRDGCIQRMRYTGGAVRFPIGLAARRNGLHIKFSTPLQKTTAEDPGSYNIEQWNYEYASRYGSKEFSLVHPGAVGRDPVEIKSAHLLDDQCTVVLEIPSIRPVMQMHVEWNLTAADGAPVRGEFFNTIHHLGE